MQFTFKQGPDLKVPLRFIPGILPVILLHVICGGSEIQPPLRKSSCWRDAIYDGYNRNVENFGFFQDGRAKCFKLSKIKRWIHVFLNFKSFVLK